MVSMKEQENEQGSDCGKTPTKTCMGGHDVLCAGTPSVRQDGDEAEVCVLGERAGQDDHGMTGGERQLNIAAGRGLWS